VRVAVLGLGLIGGSAALALEARGYDRDAAARERARERGIDAVESLAEAVKGTEVVLLAVPTSETPALLREAAAAAPDALFTDGASLKRSIAAAAAGALTGKTCFVGGHPMAGSRTAGIAGARADLFQDRPWLVVPTDRSDVHSIDAIQRLVRGIGARPAVIDAERHDALMTWVSHLPHAVAAALAQAVHAGVGSGVARIAGPGLLDATRIADTAPGLALELALAQPDALAAAIDAVRRELDELSGSLRRGDERKVRDYFESAAGARSGFSSPSPGGRLSE
jgi:prephenate dehydrogenase